MANGQEGTQAALVEVVKGLRHHPPLLFGIGAGIVLIGILAATTDALVVGIVAAVLVAALAVWLVRESRARAAGEWRTKADVDGAEIEDRANVGGIDAAGGAGVMETNVRARDAKIGKGALVGGISTSRSRPRRKG
jgi:hypothetical protein